MLTTSLAWSICSANSTAANSPLLGAQESSQRTSRFAEPSRFVVPDQARSLNSAAASTDRPASRITPRNTLRWRTSQEVTENTLRPQTQRPQSQGTQMRQPAGVHVAAEPIQQASYEATNDQVTQLNAPQQDDATGSTLRYRSPNRSTRSSSDNGSVAPIQDPFGDRQRASARAQGSAEELTDSSPWQPSSETATQWQSPSSPQLNGSTTQRNTSSQLDTPSPLTSTPQTVQLSSPATILSQPSGYYQQDTGLFSDIPSAEGARDILHGHPISGINLNVTPWYGDEARTFEQEQAARETMRETQRTSGARTWTDRNGNEIARGYLTNFENRIVYIDEGNGQTLQVLADELSSSDREFVYTTWQLPSDTQVVATPLPSRVWVPQTVAWKASALCHKPLYFEDIQLERYGHSAGPFLQPIKSTAHFFGNMLVLPYNTGIHPVNECQYALGYYRPGDCAPWLLDPIPISIRGGLRQASFITAGAITIP